MLAGNIETQNNSGGCFCTGTLFTFSIFVLISSSRSIFAVSMWFIFHFYFHFHYNIISLKQTHLFLERFLEYVLLYLDDNLDQENEQFSDSKSSASVRVLLSFCLVLCQFQSGFASKSVDQRNPCRELKYLMPRPFDSRKASPIIRPAGQPLDDPNGSSNISG